MAGSSKSLPPLEWIRVFEAAGRTGSFTAAALETGLTQSAVSQRIRNLECDIGTRLFERGARGVSLTVDGEAWLPYVASALTTLQRSTDELFENPLKKITIAASASIIQLWLAPRLSLLSRDAKYQISLHTMSIEHDFEKSGAEIEIRYGSGSWNTLRTAKLFDEELSPLAAPELLNANSRPAIPKKWQELPHIAISGPRPGWQQWTTQTQSATPPAPVIRFDSFAQALAAAKAGAGILLGSLPLCHEMLSEGSLVRVSEKSITPNSSYWLTSKDEKLTNNQWNTFVDIFATTT